MATMDELAGMSDADAEKLKPGQKKMRAKLRANKFQGGEKPPAGSGASPEEARKRSRIERAGGAARRGASRTAGVIKSGAGNAKRIASRVIPPQVLAAEAGLRFGRAASEGIVETALGDAEGSAQLARAAGDNLSNVISNSPAEAAERTQGGLASMRKLVGPNSSLDSETQDRIQRGILRRERLNKESAESGGFSDRFSRGTKAAASAALTGGFNPIGGLLDATDRAFGGLYGGQGMRVRAGERASAPNPDNLFGGVDTDAGARRRQPLLGPDEGGPPRSGEEKENNQSTETPAQARAKADAEARAEADRRITAMISGGNLEGQEYPGLPATGRIGTTGRTLGQRFDRSSGEFVGGVSQFNQGFDPTKLSPGSGFIRSENGNIQRINSASSQPQRSQRVTRRSADGIVVPNFDPANFAASAILSGANTRLQNQTIRDRNQQVRDRVDTQLASGEGRTRVQRRGDQSRLEAAAIGQDRAEAIQEQANTDFERQTSEDPNVVRASTEQLIQRAATAAPNDPSVDVPVGVAAARILTQLGNEVDWIPFNPASSGRDIADSIKDWVANRDQQSLMGDRLASLKYDPDTGNLSQDNKRLVGNIRDLSPEDRQVLELAISRAKARTQRR